MPSAKGSWFILSVRSRNGSTAMDFCGCEAMAPMVPLVDDAERLFFATLPWKRKAKTNARQSAAPAARVKPALRRRADFFGTSGAAVVAGAGCSLSVARVEPV